MTGTCDCCGAQNVPCTTVRYVVDVCLRTQQEKVEFIYLCYKCNSYIFPNGYWHLDDADIPKIYKEKAKELKHYWLLS